MWVATRIALLLTAVAPAIACVATANIRPTAKFNPTSAYIYGRFVNAGNGGTLGFAIRCRDGEIYNVLFSNRAPVQVIEIAPDACQLDTIFFVGTRGSRFGEKVPPFRLLRDEILLRGGLYYVGDFYANSTETYDHYHAKTSFKWRLTGASDNYDETTDQMKAIFTSLGSVPTENRTSEEVSKLAPASDSEPQR